MRKQWQILFSCTPKSLQMVTAAMKIKDMLLGRKAMTNLDNILKSRDITLPKKVYLFKAMCFFGSHVWMWELDHKESWALKTWCFWVVVLEKTLESPLDCKEIQPVHPRGDSGCSLEGLMLKLKLQSLATWCEQLTHLKRPWCWERLRPGGEGDDREWVDWMAPLTQWTWVWVDSGSWWWTGRPGVLRFMWSQRARYDQVTELNWICF